jgi:hypothetical protein
VLPKVTYPRFFFAAAAWVKRLRSEMEVRSALSRLVNRAGPIYTGNTQPRGSHLASSGAPSVTENYGLPEAGSRINLSLGLAQFLGLRTCSGCSEYSSGFSSLYRLVRYQVARDLINGKSEA